MSCVVRRLANQGAIPLGCVLAALWSSSAGAANLKLFTRDTFEFSGDVRLVGVNGERSWLRGGYGKLRSGDEGKSELALKPELGNVSLVWKPQFTWSLGAVVVASLQGGERTDAGLGQAYLTFRPMRSSTIAFSARAGLMWPPVSLEHEGADWHVKDSITPSAINSWIGEEVRPIAIEGTVAANRGAHKFRATAALIAANDTAGTLLTFRGWALHDRTTIAFVSEPLPPLGALTGYQASFTHPLLDVGRGFARRPGYYVKLSWQPPVPLRIELLHYDNEANPEAVNAAPEWGWRTSFNHLGAVAELGPRTEFKAQAVAGRTRMGYPQPVRRWIDERFRSAFLMMTRRVGSVRFAVRGDAFDTKNHGSLWDSEHDEHGFAAMLAAKREWGPVTGMVELLRVWSNSPSREYAEEEERRGQTQLQAQVRMHW